MLQTVLIIIHLILIAVVWYIVGYIYLDKCSAITNEEITKLNREFIISVIIGVCLNLAIVVWPIVNIRPEWYCNYMWFITLVPASITIALFALETGGCNITEGGRDIGEGAIYSCVITFVLIVFSAISIVFDISIPGPSEETTTRIDIVNVNDSKEVTGSVSGGGFLIYSVNGSVSTDNVYCYYYQQEDGGFKLASIPADDSTIYYLPEGDTKGYINKITTTTYYYDNNNYPAVKTDEVYEQSCKYEIYVPEGSIGTYYEFDGE